MVDRQGRRLMLDSDFEQRVQEGLAGRNAPVLRTIAAWPARTVTMERAQP